MKILSHAEFGTRRAYDNQTRTPLAFPDPVSYTHLDVYKRQDGTSRSLLSLWSDAMSVSGPCFAALQQQYQSVTKKGGAGANGVYIANALTASALSTGTYIYAPKYRTARSFQINIGVQREVWKGGILSVDYLRNIGEHFMQSVDENHVGDAKYLNKTAANNAINGTLVACGVSDIDSAIQSCPGLYQPDPTQPYYLSLIHI